MKKKDIVSLFNTLTQINQLEKDNTFSIKFTYAITKLSQQIDSEISILMKIQQANEEVRKEYVIELNKFCSENKGTINNGNWSFPNDKKTLKLVQEKTLELQDKYQSQLKNYENKMKEFEELLEDESQVNGLYKILDVNIIPDCVTSDLLKAFMKCGIIE